MPKHSVVIMPSSGAMLTSIRVRVTLSFHDWTRRGRSGVVPGDGSGAAVSFLVCRPSPRIDGGWLSRSAMPLHPVPTVGQSGAVSQSQSELATVVPNFPIVERRQPLACQGGLALDGEF